MRPELIREMASRLRFLGTGTYIMYDTLRDLATDENPAFVAEIVRRSNDQGYVPERDAFPWSDHDLPYH